MTARTNGILDPRVFLERTGQATITAIRSPLARLLLVQKQEDYRPG